MLITTSPFYKMFIFIGTLKIGFEFDGDCTYFSAVHMCTDHTFLILFSNSDVEFALIVAVTCGIEPTESRGKPARIQCLLWIVHQVELITFVIN